MIQFFRMAWHFVLCFVITLGILMGLLYVTAFIPKDAFRENLLESAEYLAKNEDEFYCLVDGDRRTLIHNYADVITFNIMYSIDGEDLWDELMMSPFFSDSINQDYPMIELLAERIEKEKTADTLYDRYWHGMMMLLRPLFCVFTIAQIRLILMVVLVGLLLALTILLWRRKLTALAIALWSGAILCGYPMIAMCMEYVPVWLIMLVCSFAAVKVYQNDKAVAGLSVVSGVCCAFFDFLTTETVAIVIPLVVVLCLKEKEGQIKHYLQGVRWLLAKCVLWGSAYIGTFFIKWLLASLVLGQERISFALSMMFNRQGAQSLQMEETVFSQPVAAVLVNIRLMFRISEAVSLESIFIGLLTGCLLIAAMVYLFRKKGSACVMPGLLALLGFVPVVRMLVLHNHSLEHNFFVYRSLFATIVCSVAAFVFVIDWKMLWKLLHH